MFRNSDPAGGASGDGVGGAVDAVRLTRDITATWWYTVTGVLVIEGALLVIWAGALDRVGPSEAERVVALVGGILWWLSTVILLLDYRDRPDSTRAARRRRSAVALLVALVVGAVVGFLSGLWLLALLPLAQSAMLLRWPPGVRVRVVAAATLVLVAVIAFG